MWRVSIRSRLGNAILGVLGALYFVSAIATLIYYVVTTWEAMGMIDYALQLALLGAAIGGLFFMAVAVQNLALIRSRAAAKSRSAPDHQTAAASGL